MNTKQAQELGTKIAAHLERGETDAAYKLIAPLLRERIPFAMLDRVWAYRKAVWALDDLGESVAEIFQARGEAGIREAVGVGERLAKEIVEYAGTEHGG